MTFTAPLTLILWIDSRVTSRVSLAFERITTGTLRIADGEKEQSSLAKLRVESVAELFSTQRNTCARLILREGEIGDHQAVPQHLTTHECTTWWGSPLDAREQHTTPIIVPLTLMVPEADGWLRAIDCIPGIHKGDRASWVSVFLSRIGTPQCGLLLQCLTHARTCGHILNRE